MRKPQISFAVALGSFLTLLTCAQAQTSVWWGMAMVGTINGWDTTPNMMLVADNLWQSEHYISATSNSFKFTPNNSWANQMGDTNPPTKYVPLSGVAEVTSGRDIVFTNGTPGFYRFTLNSATREYSVRLMYTDASGVNLIKNPSFEVAGTISSEARNWQWGNPDTHGGKWGRANRETWRKHSGSAEAAIYAQWGTYDERGGGWWQEGVAEPGKLYTGSAWFWADANWTSVYQDIKLEFFSATSNLLDVVTTHLGTIGQVWVKKSVSGIAPAGTAWVRLIVATDQAGRNGALQFDDAELRHIATRDQNFNGWGAYGFDGCHTVDDWMICTGKATSVDARTGYAASLLPPTAAHTNYIRSPLLEDGLGMIYFWYRHGQTNDEPEGPLSFNVQKSSDGVVWTTLATVNDVTSMQYQPFTLYEFDTTLRYLRICHIGGTNRLLIDDISILLPEETARYQDFNTWPNEGTNYGYHTYLNWVVDSGVISSVNAKEGKSLYLQGEASGINAVVSPFLADGYGTISFAYARGTNGLGEAGVVIQSSPDATNWVTIGEVSNILMASYETYSQYYYSPVGSYLRLCPSTNVSTTTLVLDEGFNNGTNPPPGWTFVDIKGTYSSTGYFGRLAPALRLDLSNKRVITPLIQSPTNLNIWVRGASTDANSYLRIETTHNDSQWVTNATVQPIPTSGTVTNFRVATNVVRVRFTYTKSAGNLALDDVIIHGTPRASSLLQGVFLDQINFSYPNLARQQNFDAWPSQTSYGEYEFQGWFASNVLVTASNAYEGQAVRLHMNLNNYVISPYLPDGLGAISFKYRHWDGDAPAVVYSIQTSSNGTSWTTITNLTITSTNYLSFSRYLYETNGVYVRFFHLSGGERVLFDDINLSAPMPPPDVLFNGWHEPSAPYTNDAVYLKATAASLNGAMNLAVTTYYRVGTSGVFSPLSMAPSEGILWASTNPIAPHPSGTEVQYYMVCSFDGAGSELTSPRYYPTAGSNAPAFYRVPRHPPGRVWINEINYVNEDWWDDDTNEFVEICGPSSWDLSGWKIEFYVNYDTNTYTYYASYILPQGSTLLDLTNGYGFYVLGDDGLPNLDMSFTHTNAWPLGKDGFDQISDGIWPSGLRLYNEAGGIEQSISYAGPIAGFDRVYAEEDFIDYPDPYSIQLGGSGTNYGNFSWGTNTFSPGAINVGQILIPPPDPPDNPPDVELVRVVMGTNIVITAYGNTNVPAWNVQPYYTTNLPVTAQNWIAVTPFFSTHAGGTNVIWFERHTNGQLYFYRVLLTEP